MTRREFIRFSAVTGLGLLAAACGGASVAPSGISSAAGSAKPSAQPQQSKPSTGPSGTLVSAISSFGQDTMDLVYSAQETVIGYPIYEALGAFDANGNSVPLLAESWTLSPDGQAWTIKLRKGVKFHNGDEFTSADVKFSLGRIMSPKSRFLSANSLRAEIDHIDTPDPYTVVVHTKKVDATFMEANAYDTYALPKKYIEEKGEAYFADHPVGTGPWKFVSHEKGASAEYEAVKNHWRITPAFQKLVLKNVPEENTRIAMLKRGEADIIEVSLDNVGQIKSGGFDVRFGQYESQPTVLIPGTWENTGQPVMDVGIRQALSLAINREEMAKTFFKGYASPAARTWMTSSNWGWNPDWKADAYDPAKAKQLLAQAGYPGKFKDPVINLYSYAWPGAGWMPDWGQIVTGYWEAIGVKTKITPIDIGAIRLMYTSKPLDPRMPGNTLMFLASPVTPQSLQKLANLYGGNVDLLHSGESVARFSKISQEPDAAKRVQLFRQAIDAGYQQHVDIPTVNVKLTYGVSSQVGEWRGRTATLGIAYEGIQHK